MRATHFHSRVLCACEKCKMRGRKWRNLSLRSRCKMCRLGWRIFGRGLNKLTDRNKTHLSNNSVQRVLSTSRIGKNNNRMQSNIIFHLLSMNQNSKQITMTLLTINFKESIKFLSRWKRSLCKSRSSSKSDWLQLFTITSRCSITVATWLVFCTIDTARSKMTCAR